MKFPNFKKLQDAAKDAMGKAQEKAVEAKGAFDAAKEKLAPYAEQAGKKIVEADKAVTDKAREAASKAGSKIADAIKKGRGPK